MKDTVRKQKSGDQLTVGDWLAPGELLDGAAEVLYVHAWPASADRSRDNAGKHVRLVVREQGSTPDYSDVVSGTTLFDLASEEDLAALREQAERAQKIADIRALADWLEANPWMPMPYMMRGQSHGLTRNDIPMVRELAERAGVKVDDSLDDRTGFDVRFGQWAEFTVIAWHRDGRPAEPEAEPVAPANPFGLSPAKNAEVRNRLGLDYSRADDEPDDPTPVSGARVEPHVGAVTDEGLVDVTPVLHYSMLGRATHCGLSTSALPRGDSWSNVDGSITCPSCLAASEK